MASPLKKSSTPTILASAIMTGEDGRVESSGCGLEGYCLFLKKRGPIQQNFSFFSSCFVCLFVSEEFVCIIEEQEVESLCVL